MAKKGKVKKQSNAIQSSKSSSNPKFKVGDLVGAKLARYPIWPARIQKVLRGGKYNVIFFGSNDTSNKCNLIKPFNEMTLTERNCKYKDFQEALKLCLEEEQARTSLPTTDNHSLSADDDDDDEPPSSNELEIDDTPQAPDRPQEETIVDAPNHSIDCSLNDLTSEQTNADRGNTNLSIVSEPQSIQDCDEDKIIAKLTKKVQSKLDEKAALKKALKEKKRYERVFKKLPKISDRFKQLHDSSEKLLKNLDDTRCITSFKNHAVQCKETFDVLHECLTVRTNDFDARKKEYSLFCKLLANTVTLVKQIKEIKDQNKETAAVCKMFIKQMKRHERIKLFINKGVDVIRPKSSKREAIVECKENPK